MKYLKCLFAVLILVLLVSGPALAHKVNLFAYAEQGTVFTESYFPDGRAVEKGKVLVYDSKDQKLLEGETDTQGMFSFDIPKIDALTIVIDAGMGHKNEFKLKKAEVEAGQ
jgi:nickel transport protein